MNLSDARLAELEARWKPVGNVVVSGPEFVALLAEVREARQQLSAFGIPEPQCGCWYCTDQELERNPSAFVGMIVCAKCGNKRCPHASHHDNECTRSNEPGQIGSAR